MQKYIHAAKLIRKKYSNYS